MAVETTNRKISRFDRLYVDGSGFDFVGRAKTWYTIAGVLLIASILAIVLRGFNLSLDFEGGTKLNMPAGDLSTEQVEETFTEATGVTPELVQIVGAGSSETLEITSERLSQDEVNQARQAIFETYQVKDDNGKPSPDAIGSSTVSESWGSSITQRMVIAMAVFLVLATIYVAVRLQRDMAFAAILALIFDGVFIAGIYALFGFEVSPAVIIGLLTVLTFSLYDSVIVFDKVDENTTGLEGQRKKTYAELTNLAVNQTVMRSISTSVISALPIIALFIVAVWLMGIGTLRDLALVQFIGVIEGVFSSIFLATTLLVTLSNQRKSVKKHNEVVAAYRAEGWTAEAEDEDTPKATRTVASPAAASAPAATQTESGPRSDESGGASWRPGR
ncbi:protein translocase subunit SecF [Corynebacterium aurimucosum]|uniref:protein translocase subunit SecF n=1 Tax=Corynebacterium aurimucosum TaxID=169292 RepID=UPI00191CDCA9|nr:protein translocase subunit SecF [Corynebacterium aurimucosum]QQU94788.1 protein translocase subunit SecF [Corynebacterium aurimucosum]UTA72305.1 protein translocase subunit SecF [Corynebacterium aurimucosum]WJY70622.1 preprotein translocase subunit SecF [Corynebacterium aurimucosum]